MITIRLLVFLLCSLGGTKGHSLRFPNTPTTNTVSGSPNETVFLADALGLVTYCIDPKVVDIFTPRINKCLGGRTIAQELHYLRYANAHHYQHAQELFAYEYFLTNKNKGRRVNCAEADFEYVPLLPFAWRLEFPVNTLCTAGGVCPPHHSSSSSSSSTSSRSRSNSSNHCSAVGLVADIIKYVRHVYRGRGVALTAGTPRFIVTGAFNFKTILGR
jgi:hypothetical protein